VTVTWPAKLAAAVNVPTLVALETSLPPAPTRRLPVMPAWSCASVGVVYHPHLLQPCGTGDWLLSLGLSTAFR